MIWQPPSIDLDAQTRKWAEKYGDEIAAGLRKRVEAETTIYEYLRARKLSLS